MDIGEVAVRSPSGTSTGRTAGEINYTLQCSVSIRGPLPQGVPFPTFEWFFGPNNASLSSGVTVSNVSNKSNTYTSILQFSSLSLNHSGMYTCRLGGNQRLAANLNITINGIIYVRPHKN